MAEKLSVQGFRVSWHYMTLSLCLGQLEYKCQWYGRQLVKIDRFFPSSKRCNRCGFVVEKMPLDVRAWDCPSCQTVGIDRDINAGKNLLAAGLAGKRLWSGRKT